MIHAELAVSNDQTKEQSVKIIAKWKMGNAALSTKKEKNANFTMIILHFAIEV
jgi:hypothetical protein